MPRMCKEITWENEEVYTKPPERIFLQRIFLQSYLERPQEYIIMATGAYFNENLSSYFPLYLGESRGFTPYNTSSFLEGF